MAANAAPTSSRLVIRCVRSDISYTSLSLRVDVRETESSQRLRVMNYLFE